MKLALKSLALSTATACLTFGVAQNAQAILITGVTAYTDISSSFSNIANTVNGVGLPGNTPSLTGTHAAYTAGNSWIGDYQGDINFNLNGSYKLTGFSFWNMSGSGQEVFGIKGVTVQASTDGTTFTAISGAPTQFAKGSGGAESPQKYSFSPVTASYVRFTVNSNWGHMSGQPGFLEAQFDGTIPPVPEPLTMLGTGVVLGALPVLKKEYAKRKNKKKDGDA